MGSLISMKMLCDPSLSFLCTLSVYMDKMLLLRTPAEQSRLLHDIPEIIADDAEVEPADNDLSRRDEKENNASPESASRGMSKPGRKSSSSNRISYNLNDGANFAGLMCFCFYFFYFHQQLTRLLFFSSRHMIFC